MNVIKTTALAGVITFISSFVFAVQVGEKAPLFSAIDQDGQSWVLTEKLGDKPIVVYFYPAAMTGGCTKQACSYRDYQAQGNAAFTVVGISGDSVENLKWFRQAENLNYTLLSDPEAAVAKAFGVPVKEGEKTITRQIDGQDVKLVRLATPARWTFVIDPKGKVVYRDDKVKPVEDLSAVLKFLNQEK